MTVLYQDGPNNGQLRFTGCRILSDLCGLQLA